MEKKMHMKWNGGWVEKEGAPRDVGVRVLTGTILRSV